MEKKSFVLALVFALLMTIGAPTVHAYLSPEDVFGSGGGTGGDQLHSAASSEPTFDPTDPTTHDAPPSKRDAESNVALRQALENQRREKEQAALFASSSASDTGIASSENIDTSLGLFDETSRWEERQGRMAEQDDGITIVIGGEGGVTTADGRVLHSGAPRTAGTGPETVLMLTMLILAGVSTLAYVQIRKKRFA